MDGSQVIPRAIACCLSACCNRGRTHLFAPDDGGSEILFKSHKVVTCGFCVYRSSICDLAASASAKYESYAANRESIICMSQLTNIQHLKMHARTINS